MWSNKKVVKENAPMDKEYIKEARAGIPAERSSLSYYQDKKNDDSPSSYEWFIQTSRNDPYKDTQS